MWNLTCGSQKCIWVLQAFSDSSKEENIFVAMLKYLILFCSLLYGQKMLAQTAQDSLPAADTVKPPAPRRVIAPPAATLAPVDSTLPNTRRDTIAVAPQNFWLADSFKYTRHPYYSFTNPTRYTVSTRQWQGKEAIFYAIIGLLIFFAFIKNGFYRYIQDLLKIFFRTTVRQRQIKEQLVQSPLPSLLLNLFFLLSIGMFLALLAQQIGLGLEYNFWILFLYCVLALMAIYGGKFIVLKFVGWALQVSDATEAYIFIVFATNKIIGMALLPFLIVLAFTYGVVSQVAVTVGVSVILGLLAYRYFLSYVTIHRQIKISFFHFLLYLCAFEITPLLLINKLLFRFLS
jgi:hypothetical protein